MPPDTRDRWDKADIILKPVGGLLTALAVAWIGYSVNLRQGEDTDARLYAELLGRREEADTNLRKDMFNSVIKSFVESRPVALEKEILDLELLAYNFHESIDLGPIFRDVYTRVLDPRTAETDSIRARYRDRIERLAREVIDKQIAALEIHGKLDANLFFTDLKNEGTTVINGTLPPTRAGAQRGSGPDTPERDFKVTVLRHNPERREIRVQLEVRTPRGGAAGNDRRKEADYAHSTFWVGFADFPMIDNTHLSDGYRCAIVLRKLDELQASITLVYFPTSRAALKDKPFYDEMMEELLRARRSVEVRSR